VNQPTAADLEWYRAFEPLDEVEAAQHSPPTGDRDVDGPAGWPVRIAQRLKSRLQRARTAEADQGTSPSPAATVQAAPATAGPLLSLLLPVGEPDPARLDRAIASVLAQSHERWELCISPGTSADATVDRVLGVYEDADQRVRVASRSEAAGPENTARRALELAGGEFAGLLGDEDALEPDALRRIAQKLAQDGELAAVYTEEDLLLDDGDREIVTAKAGISPEQLGSSGLPGRLCIVKRELLQDLGEVSDAGVGAILARLAAGDEASVAAIPEILYHRREGTASAAAGSPAAPTQARRVPWERRWRPPALQLSAEQAEERNAHIGRVRERAKLAAPFLRGAGVEIGALHFPLPTPAGAKVRYVDHLPTVLLRQEYPELNHFPLVEVDQIENGEALAGIPDASQDFLIANHFLEHSEDPIGTLASLMRVLRPTGILFLAIPDKRFTFDVDREITPLEHLIADHEQGPERSRREHYEDWSRNMEKVPADQVAARADELQRQGYSIHMHVWTEREISELLKHCQDRFEPGFDIEHTALFADHEVIAILRKREEHGGPRTAGTRSTVSAQTG
jgi:SAM-dependent methyltransferase